MVALRRRSYTADTIVIPVELPDLDAEGRRMQIRVDGSEWHRKKLSRSGRLPMTACGKSIDPRFNLGTRFESYEGQLCKDGCFTASELADSAEINAEIDGEPNS